MERIVIITRNETGVIADIAGALANAGVNIESLDTERDGEQGIVTLSTNDTNQALLALKDAGFRAATDDSLIFRLTDEPGALARVAKRFRDAGLNIQSLHILDRQSGRTVVAAHLPGPGPGPDPAGPGLHRVSRGPAGKTSARPARSRGIEGKQASGNVRAQAGLSPPARRPRRR